LLGEPMKSGTAADGPLFMSNKYVKYVKRTFRIRLVRFVFLKWFTRFAVRFGGKSKETRVSLSMNNYDSV